MMAKGRGRRGNAETLRRYWSKGQGAAKVGWAPRSGSWTRCVKATSRFLGPRAKGYCAKRMKEALGIWPGSRANKGTKRRR